MRKRITLMRQGHRPDKVALEIGSHRCLDPLSSADGIGNLDSGVAI
jgi:hypothetical protein